MLNFDPTFQVPTIIASVVTTIFFGIPIKNGLLWVYRKITNKPQAA